MSQTTRSFDNLPGSLPNSKQDKYRHDLSIPEIAYQDYYFDEKTDMRKMMNGETKEKCARCKALGIFICEHKTPVRDKFRNMYEKQGKFYESPRDYEEQLEPSIYTDAATLGSPQVNKSHNALSFQRFQLKSQREEEDARIRSQNEIRMFKRPKRKLKINSLKQNNTVSISRLSFKTTTPRGKSTPRLSNGKSNNNNNSGFYADDKNSTNGRKPVKLSANNQTHNGNGGVFPNGDENYEDEEGDFVQDLDNNNRNNNGKNPQAKPQSRQKSSNNVKFEESADANNGQKKSNGGGGCCTVM